MCREPLRSTWLLFGLVLLLAVAQAGPAMAVKAPEKLLYSLSWLGIPVGSASQEFTEDGAGRRIVSRARSNDWLSSFYPVDNRTESLLARDGLFPGESRSFRMVFKEGQRVRDRSLVFEPARRLAHFHDRISGVQADVPIAPPVFDVYASFYYVRSLPLEVGMSHFLTILDGREPRRIEVKVLRRERVSVPAGEFATVVVQPVVLAEGIFEGKRGITIWLTDDSRRLPVKAQTEVRVGSVTAVLTGGSY
jgi:hypothetical protein